VISPHVKKLKVIKNLVIKRSFSLT